MSNLEITNETISGRIPVFKIEPPENTDSITFDKITINDNRNNVSVNETALRFLRKKHTNNTTNIEPTSDLNDFSYNIIDKTITNDDNNDSTNSVTADKIKHYSDKYQNSEILYSNENKKQYQEIKINPIYDDNDSMVKLISTDENDITLPNKILMADQNLIGLNYSTDSINEHDIDSINIQKSKLSNNLPNDQTYLLTSNYEHISVSENLDDNDKKYPTECFNIIGRSVINNNTYDIGTFYNAYVLFPGDTIINTNNVQLNINSFYIENDENVVNNFENDINDYYYINITELTYKNNNNENISLKPLSVYSINKSGSSTYVELKFSPKYINYTKENNEQISVIQKTPLYNLSSFYIDDNNNVNLKNDYVVENNKILFILPGSQNIQIIPKTFENNGNTYIKYVYLINTILRNQTSSITQYHINDLQLYSGDIRFININNIEPDLFKNVYSYFLKNNYIQTTNIDKSYAIDIEHKIKSLKNVDNYYTNVSNTEVKKINERITDYKSNKYITLPKKDVSYVIQNIVDFNKLTSKNKISANSEIVYCDDIITTNNNNIIINDTTDIIAYLIKKDNSQDNNIKLIQESTFNEKFNWFKLDNNLNYNGEDIDINVANESEVCYNIPYRRLLESKILQSGDEIFISKHSRVFYTTNDNVIHDSGILLENTVFHYSNNNNIYNDNNNIYNVKEILVQSNDNYTQIFPGSYIGGNTYNFEFTNDNYSQTFTTTTEHDIIIHICNDFSKLNTDNELYVSEICNNSVFKYPTNVNKLLKYTNCIINVTYVSIPSNNQIFPLYNYNKIKCDINNSSTEYIHMYGNDILLLYNTFIYVNIIKSGSKIAQNSIINGIIYSDEITNINDNNEIIINNGDINSNNDVELENIDLNNYKNYSGYYSDIKLYSLSCEVEKIDIDNDIFINQYKITELDESNNYYGGKLIDGVMNYNGFSKEIINGSILGPNTLLYGYEKIISVPSNEYYKINTIEYINNQYNIQYSTLQIDYLTNNANNFNENIVDDRIQLPIYNEEYLSTPNISGSKLYQGYIYLNNNAHITEIEPTQIIKYSFVLREPVLFKKGSKIIGYNKNGEECDYNETEILEEDKMFNIGDFIPSGSIVNIGNSCYENNFKWTDYSSKCTRFKITHNVLNINNDTNNTNNNNNNIDDINNNNNVSSTIIVYTIEEQESNNQPKQITKYVELSNDESIEFRFNNSQWEVPIFNVDTQEYEYKKLVNIDYIDAINTTITILPKKEYIYHAIYYSTRESELIYGYTPKITLNNEINTINTIYPFYLNPGSEIGPNTYIGNELISLIHIPIITDNNNINNSNNNQKRIKNGEYDIILNNDNTCTINFIEPVLNVYKKILMDYTTNEYYNYQYLSLIVNNIKCEATLNITYNSLCNYDFNVCTFEKNLNTYVGLNSNFKMLHRNDKILKGSVINGIKYNNDTILNEDISLNTSNYPTIIKKGSKIGNDILNKNTQYYIGNTIASNSYIKTYSTINDEQILYINATNKNNWYYSINENNSINIIPKNHLIDENTKLVKNTQIYIEIINDIKLYNVEMIDTNDNNFILKQGSIINGFTYTNDITRIEDIQDTMIESGSLIKSGSKIKVNVINNMMLNSQVKLLDDLNISNINNESNEIIDSTAYYKLTNTKTVKEYSIIKSGSIISGRPINHDYYAIKTPFNSISEMDTDGNINCNLIIENKYIGIINDNVNNFIISPNVVDQLSEEFSQLLLHTSIIPLNKIYDYMYYIYYDSEIENHEICEYCNKLNYLHSYVTNGAFQLYKNNNTYDITKSNGNMKAYIIDNKYIFSSLYDDVDLHKFILDNDKFIYSDDITNNNLFNYMCTHLFEPNTTITVSKEIQTLFPPKSILFNTDSLSFQQMIFDKSHGTNITIKITSNNDDENNDNNSPKILYNGNNMERNLKMEYSVSNSIDNNKCYYISNINRDIRYRNMNDTIIINIEATDTNESSTIIVTAQNNHENITYMKKWEATHNKISNEYFMKITDLANKTYTITTEIAYKRGYDDYKTIIVITDSDNKQYYRYTHGEYHISLVERNNIGEIIIDTNTYDTVHEPNTLTFN